ncbi:MAG: hypothetical protein R3359_08235 [Marinirhabdus sp.]|nr:hypothetical protein [Marinirhabdus sp.]
MKRVLLLASFFIAIYTTGLSQESYQVEGETYTLKTDVDGTLTLLWNSIDGDYRYFVKKGNRIVELKNTKTDGRYQEEYKATLEELTADNPASASDINLTLPELRKYVRAYNKRVDPSFSDEDPNIQLGLRLGAFAGVSNSIFTQNPDNNLLPVFGVDLELVDEVKLKRHSVVLRFKQTLGNDDYDFSSSQFSLNYRLKFIKSQKIDVFLNTKFVSYTYSTRNDFPVVQADGSVVLESSSGGDLTAHGIFGLGADYQLGNGFLFFTYNDIVGLGIDSNGEFPVDFTVGYKFNL